MNRWKHDVLLRLVKFINIILISFPFAFGWVNYYAPKTASRYYWKGNALIIALFFILYLTYGRIYECFMISMNRISELIYSQCLAALISDGIMYVVAWLLLKRLPEVLPYSIRNLRFPVLQIWLKTVVLPASVLITTTQQHT